MKEFTTVRPPPPPPIVVTPVDVFPIATLPDPLALIASGLFAPLSITVTLTPLPVAKPVMLRPADCEAVGALTCSTVWVEPFAPTVSASEELDVTPNGPVIDVPPVEFPMLTAPVVPELSDRAPVPLPAIERPVLDPLSIAASATVPPLTAPVSFRPDA